MAQPQIIICNDEDGYQRDLVMWVDDTLTEDDVLSLPYGDGNPNNVIDDIYSNSTDGNFPIVISPIAWDDRMYQRHNVDWEQLYPNIPVVLPLQKQGQNPYSYPTLPATANMGTSRNSNLIIVGAGDVDTGNSSWWRSNQIEFIADAREFIPNPITTLIQHDADTIKIGSSQWSFGWYFFAVGTPIFLSGITGFGNNPSGWYQISGNIADTFVLIDNINLGGGTLGGTPVASTTFLSDTVGVVGAQLNKIRKGRIEQWGSCTWWEARHCARTTGSSGGSSDGLVGYGIIDPDLAIAVDLGSNPADPDPFITVGTAGTLAGSYDANTKKMTFTIPAVNNALLYELIENPDTDRARVIMSQPRFTPTQIFQSPESTTSNPLWNDNLDTLTFVHHPVQLGTNNYKYRGVRYSASSPLSNQIQSVIPDLIVTKQQRFTVGDVVWLMKNGLMLYFTITAHERVIENPYNDNVGNVVDYYTLSDGLTYPDTMIGVTQNHLLFKLKGNIYLNGSLDYTGYVYDPYAVTIEDICGLNLAGADLSALDLASFHFDGVNLTGATLPPEIVSKSLFRSTTRGYDATTTIYTDGTEIG